MYKIKFATACLLAFAGAKHMEPIDNTIDEYLEPEPAELAQFATGLDYDDEFEDRPEPMAAAQQQTNKSTSSRQRVFLTFNNASDETVDLFWHDYSGNLRPYGKIAPGQTRAMHTFVTHPWSVKGAGDFMVDGDDVFIPGVADRNRRISIVQKNPEFDCNRQVNWTRAGPRYSQISLTDGCKNGKCDSNPKYASDKTTCNNEEAIAYCQDECSKREANGQGCEGFFFQKHGNGHEICGFYADNMNKGQQVWGGHIAGAICERKQLTYEVVESGDCVGNQLIKDANECQDAIADVFGVHGAKVEVWNTPAYAKGCFKHNWGHPKSAQAANAPTRWIFNLNGGPGTSGHCTGEPGYAACICRD